VTFTLMGAVVLSWVRLVERRPLATIGFSGSRRARHFPGRSRDRPSRRGAMIVAAIWMAGGYHAGGAFPAFASPRALLYVGALLPCFALQSSVEEMIFRGWLLSGLARKFNVPMGRVLELRCLHAPPLRPAANTGRPPPPPSSSPRVACAWAIRSGNIWGVMGWHAAWKLAARRGLRASGHGPGTRDFPPCS